MNNRLALALVAMLSVSPFALATCHSSLCLGGGSGGPLITPSGDTMAKGTYDLSFTWELQSYNPWSEAQLDQFAMDGKEAMSLDHTSTQALAFGAGLTDKLTLGVRTQVVSRDSIRMVEEDPMNPGMSMVMDHGNSSGFGDTFFSLQWRFAQKGTTSASLLTGIKAPTGKTSETGPDGMRLSTDHQPGSGSWDGLLGVAVSHGWKRSSLHGSLGWFPTGDGSQDTRLGSTIFAGLAWVARLGKPGAEGERKAAAWDGSVELTAENREKLTEMGMKKARGSGTIVLVTPGVRLTVHDKWFLQGTWGLPLSDDTNGNTVKTSWRSSLGIGYAW